MTGLKEHQTLISQIHRKVFLSPRRDSIINSEIQMKKNILYHTLKFHLVLMKMFPWRKRASRNQRKCLASLSHSKMVKVSGKLAKRSELKADLFLITRIRPYALTKTIFKVKTMMLVDKRCLYYGIILLLIRSI
jgi:hypothetical protein